MNSASHRYPLIRMKISEMLTDCCEEIRRVLMRYLKEIVILTFLLGLLVSSASADDDQNPLAFASAGMPTDSASLVSDTGLTSATSYSFVSGFPSASSGFGASAGVPTNSLSFAVSAGYPTASSGFGASAGIPTDSALSAAAYATTAPPVAEQNSLIAYDVAASPPTAVYYGGSLIPWASFYPSFRGTTPMLWVLTRGGWNIYATCPIGGWARYLMYIPYSGSLKMYEIYPDTSVRFYNYGWSSPGYKYLWFFADTPGRHISFITLTDRPSNCVTIDVS